MGISSSVDSTEKLKATVKKIVSANVCAGCPIEEDPEKGWYDRSTNKMKLRQAHYESIKTVNYER